MINLLPQEIKQDISYARRNLKLRNWILASIVALAGVGIIVAGGLIYMQQSINDYTKQVEVSKQNLKTQNVDETQKRVAEISSNTKLTLQVLSREILFSKLIRQIGSALPANTALESLEIDETKGGVQLNASAADFKAATQLQLNLQDPKNGVFEKADINSISCNDPTALQPVGPTSAASQSNGPRYPCPVNLRALFGKNTSYFYIVPAATEGAKL